MKTTTKTLTQRPAWKALTAHHKKIKNLHLRELFADDPKRGERMTLAAAGLFLDFSKGRITDKTIKLLIQLANESGGVRLRCVRRGGAGQPHRPPADDDY